MNIIQNTIHKATKKNALNILIIPFIGDFEYQLAELGHNLFIICMSNDFNKYFDKKQKPPNIIFFPVLKDQLKISSIDSYDLIICNGRLYYNLAKNIQQTYQLPIILVEHDMPELQSWQKKQIDDEILINKPAAILSFNNKVFKHWGEIGNLFTTKDEWQNLFFNLTKGGFKK